MSKRRERIQSSGGSDRYQKRKQGHRCEHRRHPGEGRGVAGLYAEQQRTRHSGKSDGTQQSQRETDPYQRDDACANGVDDVTAPGAECHANADIANPPAHRKRRHPVDADAAEQEREEAERPGQQGRLPRLGERRVELR